MPRTRNKSDLLGQGSDEDKRQRKQGSKVMQQRVANVNKQGKLKMPEKPTCKQDNISGKGKKRLSIKEKQGTWEEDKQIEENPEQSELTPYEKLALKVKAAKRQRELNDLVDDVEPSEKNRRSEVVNQTDQGEGLPTTQKAAVIASYVEDEQMMTFDVDSEDSFYNLEIEVETESDSEGEVVIARPPGTPGRMDEEPTAHCSNQLQPGEIDPESGPQISQGSAHSKARLCEIEEEMKQRLLEIRDIMEAGGMEDTLQECFSNKGIVSDPKAKAKANGGKQDSRRVITISKQQWNKNKNAVTVDKIIEQARSEATVYKNAVDKRGSSSSEDEFALHSSDESFNNIVDGLYISGKTSQDQGQIHPMNDQRRDDNRTPRVITAKEWTDQVIKNAEVAKAKVFPPKGESSDTF